MMKWAKNLAKVIFRRHSKYVEEIEAELRELRKSAVISVFVTPGKTLNLIAQRDLYEPESAYEVNLVIGKVEKLI